MTPVRYAVVGTGWISQEAFLPAVAQTGNSIVAALVSGSAANAAKLAAFYDVPEVVGYDDYDSLISSDRIDAVYIALPNSLHADYTIRALKAGKHVMVEKPLATTLAEGEAMVAAAKASGAYLMTAYRLHTEPATLAVLDMLRQGSIGTPQHFSSTFAFQTALGNHRLQVGHWGGPLQDVGVYCLNAARHVFGAEPRAVQAMSTRPPQDPRFTEVDASWAVTLDFGEGRLAQFFCSFGAHMSEHYRILGTTGEILVDPGYRFESALRVTLRTAEGEQVIPYPQVDHFAGQIAAFSDCIQTGTPPLSDGAEGLADMVGLLAIEQSARMGAQVAIPPSAAPAPLAQARRFPMPTRKLLL